MSERFNLLSPEVKANPYPTYARMRREAPVCQVEPGGMWAVSRHEDVLRVLKDPQRFSSQGFRVATNPPWLGGNPFSESMLTMDPPQHGRLRVLVQKAFGAGAMARLEPRVRDLCRQAVAELPRGVPVDLMPPYALRIPAAVISELLGLDPTRATRLKQWADLITGGVTTVRPEEEDRKQRARDAVAELRQYFGEVLDARARAPGTDLVSELQQARVDGEALSKDELIAFMALLLVGGIETVVHLLGASLVVLREHPEIWAQLRSDRSRIPAFIDEVLRYEPPAQAAPRLTTEAVELGGVRLPKGAPVLVLLGSAAHDDAHFPDGDRFNLSRPGPQNLPFGHGVHFCLGAQLARMEGRLALEALLDAFRHLQAGPEPMTWHRTLVVRGPATLPLVLHPH
ncbi:MULTISPECIES: cytochrome P450 [unclassified Corallococcus]|uniref:cytochrome P450 n=1 Tax=unclassified Corallococcus TaxID=2685029 RepID=UPI001A8EE0FC|nr:MULTISPECIES: cytochrome P450 [unclassified Corallococcus]MBN9685087.1 cytochrome P450 [Corallococcus sp. NCSPR001]WAS83454.1 cytochrome P450 [Corallococcus sp. NCRR]